jgi:hypothetical protein
MHYTTLRQAAAKCKSYSIQFDRAAADIGSAPAFAPPNNLRARRIFAMRLPRYVSLAASMTRHARASIALGKRGLGTRDAPAHDELARTI